MPVPGQPDRAVCAVDAGTTAVRAGIVHPDGRISATARKGRHSDQASTAFDPEQLWADVATVLSEITADPDAERLAGIGVTAHVGAVVVDARGEAVWEGLGWADTRGTDLLAAAWARLPDALDTVGRPAVTGSGLAALAWLRSHQPREFGQARWLLAPKDWLVSRLTGAFLTDITSAAYTLALDIRHRQWASQLCLAAGIDPAILPPVHQADRVVGAVSARASRRTGLPTGLPVIAGGPDGAVGMAALADPNMPAILDVAGTTDVVTRVTAGLPSDPPSSAVVNPYLTDGNYSWGGPTGMTGGAASFLTGLLNLGEISDRMAAQIDSVAPGCQGLRVIPTFTGARFPRWLPGELGAITGLSASHTAAHILRASQEGAAHVVRECADLLAAGDDRHARLPVILAGGTARSPSLMQLRADVLGRTVLACPEPEIGLLGAAVLTAVGCGLYPALDAARGAMSPHLQKIVPEPRRARRYVELHADWLSRRDLAAETSQRPVR
jgi:xylulokinase